jgi:site-specific DNA recombinase
LGNGRSNGSARQATFIRDNLLADITEHTKETESTARRLNRRIDAVQRERRKWAEKAMNGTVPDDLAREKQQELAAQLRAAKSARAKLTMTSEQHEAAIRGATALLPSCGEAYWRGNEQLRREYNQAWFEKIYIAPLTEVPSSSGSDEQN